MSEAIQIRAATISDVESIKSLLATLGYELDNKQLQKNMEALRNNAANKTLLAMSNNAVIGLVAVSWQQMLHHAAPVARITDLVVKEDQQGRGIGQKLLSVAEDIAKENGCPYIELTTALHRKEAQNFYARAGYEQTSLKFQKLLIKGRS